MLALSCQMLGQILVSRLNLSDLLSSGASTILGTEKELNKYLWKEQKTEWMQRSLEDWSAQHRVALEGGTAVIACICIPWPQNMWAAV